MESVELNGFTSYFMESTTIPSTAPTVSQTGQIWWRSSDATTTGELTVNADLMGIDSVGDCFKACHVVTDGDCWMFR